MLTDGGCGMQVFMRIRPCGGGAVRSVDVAAVAFGIAERLDEGCCVVRGETAGCFCDFVEGLVDVESHAGSVAADIEDGSLAEPVPEFGGFLFHAVLDVDLAFLVAAEGSGEAGEGAIGEEVLPFRFVEEVGAGTHFTEEEPSAAAGGGGAAFFKEGAEGGDARAWTAEDDGGFVVRQGESESFAWVDEAGDERARRRAFGEPCGSDPLAAASVAFVAYGGDGEVDFVRVGAEAAAD